jgi:periodic tryptophan protein 1
LASSSDDHTVKVWDLSSATCAFSHNVGESIVDTIRWDNSTDSVLISGSDDGYLRISDIRDSKEIAAHKCGMKIESFCQDPLNPQQIHASLENGHIFGIDLRSGVKTLYDLSVSNKPVTNVALSPHVKGLICTSGFDGTMNVYNHNDYGENGKPKFVTREFANQGNLFGGQFSGDTQLLYTCGSSKGEVVIWTMEDNKPVKEAFGLK